ncbi:hypothetical protein P8C59_004764 [Phyllachora maydis]|uniref:Exportin-T n=1 Tax=Phyllachora maydis TaxID=1825666 RepID=A0AAD9I4T0_9PEZI|nr:hypothetical protein P8C59_004764 [Phyllachora maydis]
MDEQIANAIEIAFNPAAAPSLKEQAYGFLQQLRHDPQAWSVGFDLFTRYPRQSDVVRLFSLDIVNNAIQSRSLDVHSLVLLKDSAVGYLTRTYGGSGQSQVDSGPLQNKLTQTLTYIFSYLYREGWESFLDDFLGLTHMPNSTACDNPAGVVLYLRILSSIHDEIADVMLSRAAGTESKRNTDLKDLIRQRDMHKVAASWKDILSRYRDHDDTILDMTLKVIGKWVSWIDISLVITQEMQGLLLSVVGRMSPQGGEDRVRDAAIDTFTEIVAKKMKPTDKVGLVEFLNLREIVAQLIASPPLNEFKGTPQYDHELAESVAKLVNVIMTDIVRVVEDSNVDNETRAKAERLLQDFLNPLLRFFSDEYDEICSTVIPSLTDLLSFLRKARGLPQNYSQMLPPILNAIILKMRYDETSDWGNEDEQADEAEFQELRKRLQILQKTVAAIDQSLYMNTLSRLVETTLATLQQQGSQMDWRDVDLALHEMNMFGELALPNTGIMQKSQPDTVAAQRLLAMMSKLVDSGIANLSHPALLLQYMEICVRIRTRSWYLFLRFVKQLRAQVGNVAGTIIQSIGDLLPIKAEVPGNDADEDMSSDETDRSADAVFNSQLHLYEAIGCISSTSSTPADKQALYAHSNKDEMAMFLRLLGQVVHGFKGEIFNFLDLLLTPLLERVFVGLSEPISGTDDEIQLQELRREFLAFINVILINNLAGVLISTTNQQIFESLISSIITLTKTIDHGSLPASKTGFNVLSKMSSQWGGPDVKPLPQPANQPVKPDSSATEIPGFGQFMIDRFHSACWEVLLDPNFKPWGDAQSKMVLNEIAALELIIYSKTGDNFIRHLETSPIAQHGIDVATFVSNLTSGDRKGFQNYLLNVVKSRKT